MTRRRSILWLALAGIVVVGAIAQGLTAAPGYAATGSTAFVWAAVGSTAALYAQLALATAGVTALAGHDVSWRPIAAWAAIVVAAAVALGVVAPLLLPLVAVAALVVLPAAGAGRRNALSGFAVYRRAPIRAVLATLVTLVACALTAVVALVCGLFLTGVAGGIATWLWAGAVGVLLLVWWARLETS